MPKQNELNLIWIDLEMTGLTPETDVIVEIATIVTDPELNILAEGPVLAISQPEEKLELMGDWVREQHTKSGLLDRIRASTVTVQDAENQTLEFLAQYVPANKSPMCGNSICMDRRFLYQYMKNLEQYFHYRHIDVSTIKELALRWKGDIMSDLKKQGKHLALDDIKDSIAELSFYRTRVFNI